MSAKTPGIALALALILTGCGTMRQHALYTTPAPDAPVALCWDRANPVYHWFTWTLTGIVGEWQDFVVISIPTRLPLVGLFDPARQEPVGAFECR
jgi:hypothetical protein